jgi:hypothetical protein
MKASLTVGFYNFQLIAIIRQTAIPNLTMSFEVSIVWPFFGVFALQVALLACI